jgi:transcriptional regulator with XRE-family HTH domain
MSAPVDAIHELAVFLRARREALEPADTPLTGRGRARRTPGLRREEVAELANVSVDYVIRLEQGRGLRPSADVLEALARALRLNDDEHTYVFDLARHWTAARRQDTSTDSLRALVHALSPLPAMLVNRRFDILAWNAELAALMIDFAELPEAQRNMLWLCVLHPAMRDFYLDRERVIREGIADLRAAWAAQPDDAALGNLVGTLTSQSTEFADLWEQRDVMVNGHGRKRLLHPDVGPLSIDYDVLAPLGNPGYRLVVYRAADPDSQTALDKISSMA